MQGYRTCMRGFQESPLVPDKQLEWRKVSIKELLVWTIPNSPN